MTKIIENNSINVITKSQKTGKCQKIAEPFRISSDKTYKKIQKNTSLTTGNGFQDLDDHMLNKFGFVHSHFLDLILAKNGINFNPFLGFYISFAPKRCY